MPHPLRRSAKRRTKQRARLLATEPIEITARVVYINDSGSIQNASVSFCAAIETTVR
jgi:hypothetical protein